MLDLLFNALAVYIHPVAALFAVALLAGVALAFMRVIYKKSRWVFEGLFTRSAVSLMAPRAVVLACLVQGFVGICGSSWFYFQTELSSPFARRDLIHPFGPEFMRLSDWFTIFAWSAMALLTVVARLAGDLEYFWAKWLTIAMAIGLVPSTALIWYSALTDAKLLTLSTTLPLLSWQGFFWWACLVPLNSAPIGIGLLLGWVTVRWVWQRSATLA